MLAQAVLFAAGSMAAAAGPVISEFLAANQTGLRDGDGVTSDWIEIHNPDSGPVDLGGWHLTDDPDRPAKWTFPPLVLPAGGLLTVFASGATPDDYVDGAGNLHTPFKLSSEGEYLALVAPDGATVASVLAPAYPPQFSDVSYGRVWSAGSGTNVLTGLTDVEVLVPADDALGLAWTAPGFTAGDGWTRGPGPGVGYDLNDTETVAGLVAAWGLDDAVAAVTVRDVTGGGHDGVPVDGVVFGGAGAGPETGSCAAFDDGGIDVPYAPALNPPSFTFAAWVRPHGVSSAYQSVVTSRYDVPNQFGYILYLTPRNTWEFWTGPGGGAGWHVLVGPEAAPDEWTHLAISFDQATQLKTLIVNGEVAATAVDQAYVPNTGRDLHLGSGDDFGNQYRLAGEIDDAALWSEAVDLAVIDRHRDEGLAGLLAISFDPLISVEIEAAMHAIQSSCYIRMPFAVADPGVFDRLTLRVYYNDGFAAFLNGTPVASRNAPAVPAWNAATTALRSDEETLEAEIIELTAFLPQLAAGTNVLAIHGLNRAAEDPDFVIRAELAGAVVGRVTEHWGYLAPPSPGVPNPAVPANPGPRIADVSHPPGPLPPGQGLAISAAVAPRLDPVQSVTVHWRVMYGPEETVPLRDDGAGGDLRAGDGIYTGAIPPTGAAPRQMVRYYLTATDAAGRQSRFPAFLDATGENQSPAYLGTVVADPDLTSPLPILQWFTEDVPNSDTRIGCRASAWFQDRFYDNIFVRQRGQATAIGSQKFDFNRGDPVYVNERLGKVGELNLNTPGADPDVIRQPLAFEVFAHCGVAASESFPVLMYRNGGYQRVGLLIEQVDEDFLRRYDMNERGALYKMVQRYNYDPAFWDTITGVEKKTRREEDFADIDAFIAGIRQADAGARAAYLFDHLNLPQVINYLAAKTLIRDVDSVRKNFYFHRDTDGSGEWSMLPWDEDFTFGMPGHDIGPWVDHIHLGDASHKLQPADQWNVLFDALFTAPEIAAMYHRRLRTLMDRILLPPGSPPGSSLIEQRAEGLIAAVQADYRRDISSAGIVSWLAGWRENLYGDFGPGGAEPLLPPAQAPAPDLAIGAIEFNPSSGNQDEEYVEVVNPGPVAVDISGWRLSNAVVHVFAPGTVIPAGRTLYSTPDTAAFRARALSPTGGERRFVQGNYQGRLSNAGASVCLLDAAGRVVSQRTYAGAPSPAQQLLVVSEIMYHPSAIPEAEFLEVMNIHSAESLDLAGIRFTAGIAFEFAGAAITEIAPRGRAVIVRDLAAFEAVYGPGHPVAGVMGEDSRLDNSGERLKLVDAEGDTIQEFAYDDAFPWPAAADGSGYSLTLIRPEERPDPGQPANWRISVAPGGSPGGSDASTFAAWAVEQGLPGALPGDDPDADGVPNLFEYAYRTSPSVPSADLVPRPGLGYAADLNDRTRHLSLSVRRNLAADDLALYVEYSPSLLPWQAGPALSPATVTPNGDGSETWIYRVTEPVQAAGPQGFLRWRVAGALPP